MIYYPDIVVACGPPPDDERLEDAPCLVVEVPSPSTESTDRREKLMVYKGIHSLGAYFVVDQMQRRVDSYWRDPDGEWRHDAVVDQGALRVPCSSLDVTLTLDEVYEGVTIPSPEERIRLREEEAVRLMRPRAIFKAARAMLVAGAFVCAAASASAQAGDSVPSPFTLLRRSLTEPSWAATLRLRNAESRFRDDPQWRSAYCQLRAQSEIWLGDHAAALREIGKCWGGWSDTTYSIPAGTRLRTA